MFIAQEEPPVEFVTEARLLKFIGESEQNLILSRIHGSEDLRLNKSTYRTKAGFMFTHLALGSLMKKMLLPGMNFHLTRLAGIVTNSMSRNKPVDAGVAVSILNQLVDLRGNTLRGQKLLVDNDSKTIRDIVGCSYKLIPSYLWVSALSEVMNERHVEFQKGLVVDHKVQVRYLLQDTSPLGIEGMKVGYCIYHDPTKPIGIRRFAQIAPMISVIGSGSSLGKEAGLINEIVRNRKLDITNISSLTDLLRPTVRQLDLPGMRTRIEELTKVTIKIDGNVGNITKAFQLRDIREGISAVVRRTLMRLSYGGVKECDGLSFYLALLRELPSIPPDKRIVAERTAHNYFDGDLIL